MILKPPDSVHSPLERGGNYNDKGIGGAPALCAGTPGDVVTPSFHNISPESHWCCRGQPHGRQLWVSFSASTSHPPCPDTHLDGEDDGDLGHIGDGKVQRWRWPYLALFGATMKEMMGYFLETWTAGKDDVGYLLDEEYLLILVVFVDIFIFVDILWYEDLNSGEQWCGRGRLPLLWNPAIENNFIDLMNYFGSTIYKAIECLKRLLIVGWLNGYSIIQTYRPWNA